MSLAAERTCGRYGAHLVGGDTKPGPVRTVVGFALGWGRADHLAPRTGARVGDLLATTGTVGRGGLAAERLRSSAGRSPRVLSELLTVRPRVPEGLALARWAHAMLDTSDGVAEATRLLASASGVRAIVEEAQLPLAPGLTRIARNGHHRRALAFYGVDYELLVALSPRDLLRARRAVRAVGCTLTPIGRVERGRGAWLSHEGSTAPMPPAGWQPFDRAVHRAR